jgi:hypothetical protein
VGYLAIRSGYVDLAGPDREKIQPYTIPSLPLPQTQPPPTTTVCPYSLRSRHSVLTASGTLAAAAEGDERQQL